MQTSVKNANRLTRNIGKKNSGKQRGIKENHTKSFFIFADPTISCHPILITPLKSRRVCFRKHLTKPKLNYFFLRTLKQMQETNISGRLAKGLQNYDLSLDEIKNGSWFYCGGDSGKHLSYWLLRNATKRALKKKEWSMPPHEDHCACGHFIEKNCYISNKKQILVIGNCCIKKFLKAKERTCELCGNEHKNRRWNLCNNCWVL
jgi:hypothetical protein